MTNFSRKLSEAIVRHHSLLCVGLDPNPELLPACYRPPYHQPGADANGSLIPALKQWLSLLIAETAELVCAYKPTLGFYTALGTEGLALLKSLLANIPPHLPIILDAKHGDLNTSSLLAQTLFEDWHVDAVTVSPHAGQDLVAPFLVYAEQAVFVLCHTSNPGATPLQTYPHPDKPYYLQVVQEAETWGTPDQVGLEVGTTEPEILRKVRTIAPESTILLRSLWAEPQQLPAFLQAGLKVSGDGLLIPVPQDMLSQDHPGQSIRQLRDEINQICAALPRQNPTCDLWLPDARLPYQHAQADLILQLYDNGCIMFGDHVQASGITLPYYVDLRTIISNPQLFDKVLNAYGEILMTLQFDRIAGIPYGSLPTATGLALQLNRPMIFPRKEVKAHGTRKLVEGHYEPGETVVVVDDILISGNSAIEGAEKLQSVGLLVEDIVVLIDHGQAVQDRLAASGYRSHSVLNIMDIAQVLRESDRIDAEQSALLSHLSLT